MMSQLIYLDNHATTRVDPRVLEAMLPYFSENYGNAASVTHVAGQDAVYAIDEARRAIAEALDAQPREIVFTSGATEANNLAIKGVAHYYGPSKGRHIITAAVEHPAVLDTCMYLAENGYDITVLPVDADGHIDLNALAEAIRPNTILVSLMFGNNEIGTINPISTIGQICRDKDVLFHTDATQAVGKEMIDVEAHHIDLLSLSGHKIYGPKGVGALYVRRRNPRVRLAAQIHGGGHENGFRSGTLNVPGIVGLAKAIEIAYTDRETDQARIRELRDHMLDTLSAELDEIQLNGPREPRLAGNLNLCFRYVEATTLMMRLPHVAVSTGSACASAQPEPSHVLRAIGLSEDDLRSSIRFGLGRFNTRAEIDAVLERLIENVKALRKLSPLYAIQ